MSPSLSPPPLDDELLELVQLERAAPALSASSKQHLWGMLAQRIALPGGAAWEQEPPRTWTRRVIDLFQRRAPVAVVAFAMGGLAGGVAHDPVVRALTPRATPLRSFAIPSMPPLAISPTDGDARLPQGGSQASAPVAPAVPREHPPGLGSSFSRDRSLFAERSLIDMARTALSRGDPAECLRSLKRHAATFAQGQLAEERESLWVQALAASGEDEKARARAAEFSRRFPSSLVAPPDATAPPTPR